MSSPHDSLRTLDYAVLQQCMHCGLCLPTCPTYDATHKERNSPRGRIGLMRAIADGKLEATKTFAEEMYFCLGCLACQTACPAGVDYAQLFETARSEAERSGTLQSPARDWTRRLLLAGLFTRPRLLRLVGRLLRVYQASGLQRVVRTFGLRALLPARLRQLEPQTPQVRARFSHDLIRPVERSAGDAPVRHRVAVLTGCVQDLVFSDVNRDTVDVLLANGCEVHTPPVQPCCGSLHAHNGELDAARALARRALDLFDLTKLDAVITNAAGCGGHLKGYGRLLEHDPAYRDRAAEWSRKCKDITEYLVEIGFRKPGPPVDGDLRAPLGVPQAPGISGASRGNGARRSPSTTIVTYHEACHLCHGQKITAQPRELLRAIPGLNFVELPESTWCCGSAGIYNLVQPAMSADLLDRKLRHVAATGATCVATANPGCHLQLENGLKARTNLRGVTVRHPVSLLAAAYREEKEKPLDGGD